MGRKKKSREEEIAAAEAQAKDEKQESKHDDPSDDSDVDSSDFEVRRKNHDIDPEVQELAYAFNIDGQLTQQLNDIMIEDRRRTWSQDLERLYEILKEAHTPSAMLRLKLRDMEKGTFVGKAKCGPRVRELARKHRLDKGAANKLEEAMSMREARGKDVEKDLNMLDEHLQASNAPSKLVSMKLESLRKGFNIGHCIYSREPMVGGQGPGVDGVFNKRQGTRPLGYTDADLDRRFAEQDILGGGGKLMDEATVRKMMAAEKQKHKARVQEVVEPELPREKDRSNKKQRDRERDRRPERSSPSRSKGRKSKRSRSRSKDKSKTGSRRSRDRSAKDRGSPSPAKARDRATSPPRKERGSPSPARARDRASSPPPKERGSPSPLKGKGRSSPPARKERERRSPSGRRRKSPSTSRSRTPKKKRPKAASRSRSRSGSRRKAASKGSKKKAARSESPSSPPRRQR